MCRNIVKEKYFTFVRLDNKNKENKNQKKKKKKKKNNISWGQASHTR